jgi:drug/metabolite transporter (DMT)-like permease
LAIGLFGYISGRLKGVSLREKLMLIGCGVVVGAHWVCFFGAIKQSNISIALCAISTNSFFVALMGPAFGRGPWRIKEFVLSAVVIVGLICVFRFELHYWQGIALGLLAASLSAFFSLANAGFIKRVTAVQIAYWEMVGALLGLCVFMIFSGEMHDLAWPSFYDLKCLLFLGVVCTAFALMISVEVMKQLSPFTCALTINLEPIYTIIIALLLYGESEYMSFGFYLGLACILSTLALDLYWRNKVV